MGKFAIEMANGFGVEEIEYFNRVQSSPLRFNIIFLGLLLLLVLVKMPHFLVSTLLRLLCNFFLVIYLMRWQLL